MRKFSQRSSQHGGIVQSLGVKQDDVQNDWVFRYIAAHGVAIPKGSMPFEPAMVEVPENTYILFIAKSGFTCGEHEDSILNLLTISEKKQLPRFYRTFTNLMNGQNTSISFFKTGSNFKTANGPLTETEIMEPIGIYKPGDMYPDLMLHFSTSFPNFFETGMYELPMSAKILDMTSILQEEIKEYIVLSTRSGLRNLKTEEYLIDRINAVNEKYETMSENILYNPGSEFLEFDKETKSIRLSSVLGSSIPAGKKRLYVIYACRVPPDVENKRNIAKLRRASLTQHE